MDSEIQSDPDALFWKLRIAYLRGAEWRDQNGSMELSDKASYDYADKVTSTVETPTPQDNVVGGNITLAQREAFAKALYWELENHDRCPPEARDTIRRHSTVRLIMQRLDEACPAPHEAAPVVTRRSPNQLFRHVKRGTTYEKVALASLQCADPCEETAVLVIYRGEDGKVWARPHDEFHDGRFEKVQSDADWYLMRAAEERSAGREQNALTYEGFAKNATAEGKPE